MSLNPNAISLLLDNIGIIWLNRLSKNAAAVEFLKQNLYLIDWNNMCMNSNPNAMHLLEQNKSKIDFYFLSQNNNIFVSKKEVEIIISQL